MSRGETVGMVGAGRFGTALANLVAQSGRDVILWSRTAEVVAEINEQRTNERLPGIELPPSLSATADPAELAAKARLLVIAVPSTDVYSRARLLGDVVDPSHLIVHAVGALSIPHDLPDEHADELFIHEIFMAETPVLRVGVLAGPALPGDLCDGNYSSMVVASPYDEVTAHARRLLGVPPALRVYSGRDMIGVELSAALSQVYTLALGMSDALGIGPGPRAVLITRAVAEASRLCLAAGGEEKTFSGLAGLGNLLVRTSAESCAHSPDYQLGLALGAGKKPDLTEGGRAAQAGARLAAKLKVRMPVLTAVEAVVSGKVSAVDAAQMAGETVAHRE